MRIVFLLSLLAPVVAVATGGFSDMPERSPLAEPIKWAVATGIVDGYPDGTFRPDESVNRAEAVKMLIGENVLAVCQSGETPFYDVPATEWYAKYVCTAQREGIAQGRSATEFVPTDGVTFAEVSALLRRQHPNLAPTGYRVPGTCQTRWWCDGTAWLAALGGIPEGVNSVHKKLTRAQFVIILQAISEGEYTYEDGALRLVKSPNPNSTKTLESVYPSSMPTVVDSHLTFAQATEGSAAPEDVLATQRLISVEYIGFDGARHVGQIMVHEALVDDTAAAFEAALAEGFPIEAVIPASEFDWSDDAIMAANVSSAFNYRPATGLGWISHHGYGFAVDVNPRINAYFSGQTVLPPGGTYIPGDPGVITPDSAFYRALVNRGWSWGGHWSTPKDYHHFQKLIYDTVSADGYETF